MKGPINRLGLILYAKETGNSRKKVMMTALFSTSEPSQWASFFVLQWHIL